MSILPGVTSPRAFKMHKPDFSQGFHERWEAWLHWIREDAKKHGVRWKLEDENLALRRYLTENHAIAHEPVRCEVCSEEIADCRLKRIDPFAVPPAVKERITLMRRRSAETRWRLTKI
jgi:uncharacterized protein YktB (UPF0637 family)